MPVSTFRVEAEDIDLEGVCDDLAEERGALDTDGVVIQLKRGLWTQMGFFMGLWTQRGFVV